MGDFTLSDKARSDLKHIYQYGYSQWGEAQADRYIHEIYDRFSLIADFPEIGSQLHLPDRDLYKFTFVSHIIVYVPEEWGVRIIRVFDAAMDYMRYLR